MGAGEFFANLAVAICAGFVAFTQYYVVRNGNSWWSCLPGHGDRVCNCDFPLWVMALLIVGIFAIIIKNITKLFLTADTDNICLVLVQYSITFLYGILTFIFMFVQCDKFRIFKMIGILVESVDLVLFWLIQCCS